MSEASAEIGVIGLAVMGANLALNIADNNHKVAVFNRTASRTEAFVAAAGRLSEQIVPSTELTDFVRSIKRPRSIILMVKAGEAVDQQIELLKPLLEDGDTIIDAGNANFHDTRRRFDALDGSGVMFVGMGVSGGEEGARFGPSIMVGGTSQSYAAMEPVLNDIAAKYNGEACQAHLGSDGAGHFVKTIHNGIEYADMQMIAEIYGLLRDGLGMPAQEIGAQFDRWNEGPLNSYLIEIAGKALAATDADTGQPVVDIILDRAGQKGTGRWSAIESQMLGVPATAIESAVASRSLSARKDEREAAEQLYGALTSGTLTPRDQFMDDLGNALFAGKIAAYAQGFAVMVEASSQFGWNLPMATVAKIWREGCIIRSQFLDVIAAAYDADPPPANLLAADNFVPLMAQNSPSLRRIVADAAIAGLPVPALAAALGYFDSYRQGRGTANMIQAQRDFFGAHGFERIDQPGAHHGPWAMGLGA